MSQLPAMEESSSTDGNLVIGVLLSLVASVLIGSSFILTKKSLQQLSHSGRQRAAEGGLSYLTQRLWWAGMACLALGEVVNFVAYTFAPAAVVTPLGAASVLVAAVLAAAGLGETMRTLPRIGCWLGVLGSTVLVLHAPQQPQVRTLSQLTHSARSPAFVVFLVGVVAALALLLHAAPRHGRRHVLLPVLVCSLFGALSVLCCKTLALGLQAAAYSLPLLLTPLMAFCFFALLGFLTLQIYFLNKALDAFPTNVVTPVHYVTFTISVLAASGILFREWAELGAADCVGMVAGLAICAIGVAMIQAYKDVDVPPLWSVRPQRPSRGEPLLAG